MDATVSDADQQPLRIEQDSDRGNLPELQRRTRRLRADCEPRSSPVESATARRAGRGPSNALTRQVAFVREECAISHETRRKQAEERMMVKGAEAALVAIEIANLMKAMA